MMSKQWIWRAMKEWDDAHDLEAKGRLQRILKESLYIYTSLDTTIFINKSSAAVTLEQPTGYDSKEAILNDYFVHMPDLFSVAYPQLAVEIDGDWHFNTAKGIKQTNKRNENYDYAKIQLLWMTPKEILKSKTDEILCGTILGLMDQPHNYFVP